MIKSTIAALAATPLLFSGAAFAGPYVNVEASGSYPDGAYESGTWEFQLDTKAQLLTELTGMYLVVQQLLIQKLLMSSVILN